MVAVVETRDPGHVKVKVKVEITVEGEYRGVRMGVIDWECPFISFLLFKVVSRRIGSCRCSHQKTMKSTQYTITISIAEL